LHFQEGEKQSGEEDMSPGWKGITPEKKAPPAGRRDAGEKLRGVAEAGAN